MTIAALFAVAAFLASVLTTVLSLLRTAQTLVLRLREIAGLSTRRIEAGIAQLSATEVGHAIEGDALVFGVIRFDVRALDLVVSGEAIAAPRIWTRPEDFERAASVVEKRATGVLRTRTLELGVGTELFAADSILMTHDPRPAMRRHLWLIRGAALLAIASTSVALALAFLSSHPEIGALWALAHFLLMPVAEHRLRALARAPDDGGRVFVEKSFA